MQTSFSTQTERTVPLSAKLRLPLLLALGNMNRKTIYRAVVIAGLVLALFAGWQFLALHKNTVTAAQTKLTPHSATSGSQQAFGNCNAQFTSTQVGAFANVSIICSSNLNPEIRAFLDRQARDLNILADAQSQTYAEQKKVFEQIMILANMVANIGAATGKQLDRIEDAAKSGIPELMKLQNELASKKRQLDILFDASDEYKRLAADVWHNKQDEAIKDLDGLIAQQHLVINQAAAAHYLRGQLLVGRWGDELMNEREREIFALFGQEQSGGKVKNGTIPTYDDANYDFELAYRLNPTDIRYLAEWSGRLFGRLIRNEAEASLYKAVKLILDKANPTDAEVDALRHLDTEVLSAATDRGESFSDVAAMAVHIVHVLSHKNMADPETASYFLETLFLQSKHGIGQAENGAILADAYKQIWAVYKALDLSSLSMNRSVLAACLLMVRYLEEWGEFEPARGLAEEGVAIAAVAGSNNYEVNGIHWTAEYSRLLAAVARCDIALNSPESALRRIGEIPVQRPSDADIKYPYDGIAAMLSAKAAALDRMGQEAEAKKIAEDAASLYTQIGKEYLEMLRKNPSWDGSGIEIEDLLPFDTLAAIYSRNSRDKDAFLSKRSAVKFLITCEGGGIQCYQKSALLSRYLGYLREMRNYAIKTKDIKYARIVDNVLIDASRNVNDEYSWMSLSTNRTRDQIQLDELNLSCLAFKSVDKHRYQRRAAEVHWLCTAPRANLYSEPACKDFFKIEPSAK